MSHRVVGSITAKLVRLFATAYIDGDVTHEQLAMETGAYFQGRSQKLQRPSQPASAEPAPEAPQQAAQPAESAVAKPGAEIPAEAPAALRGPA